VVLKVLSVHDVLSLVLYSKVQSLFENFVKKKKFCRTPATKLYVGLFKFGSLNFNFKFYLSWTLKQIEKYTSCSFTLRPSRALT